MSHKSIWQNRGVLGRILVHPKSTVTLNLLAHTAGLVDQILSDLFKMLTPKLVATSCALLIQPSSAAAERVFSLLNTV